MVAKLNHMGLAGDDVNDLAEHVLVRNSRRGHWRDFAAAPCTSSASAGSVRTSADDRVISIEDNRSGASVLAGALHVLVDGLGHRRILADAAVIAAVVRFVINVE